MFFFTYHLIISKFLELYFLLLEFIYLIIQIYQNDEKSMSFSTNALRISLTLNFFDNLS